MEVLFFLNVDLNTLKMVFSSDHQFEKHGEQFRMVVLTSLNQQPHFLISIQLFFYLLLDNLMMLHGPITLHGWYHEWQYEGTIFLKTKSSLLHKAVLFLLQTKI